MSPNQNYFSVYKTLEKPKKVWMGDNNFIYAVAEGNIKIETEIAGKKTTRIIQNALHVPELSGNLLSVSHLAKNKQKVLFVDDKCLIMEKDNSTCAEGYLNRNLYIINMRVITPVRAYIANADPKDPNHTPKNIIAKEILNYGIED
jgi:hypothetical protein